MDMDMFEDQMDNLEQHAIDSNCPSDDEGDDFEKYPIDSNYRRKRKGNRCNFLLEIKYETTNFIKVHDSNVRIYKDFCYIGLYKNKHLWFKSGRNSRSIYHNRYYTKIYTGTKYKPDKKIKIPEFGYSDTIYFDPWSIEMKTENQLKVYNEYKRLVNEINKSNDKND